MGAGDQRPQVFETARQTRRGRDPAPARCRTRSPRPGRRGRADPGGRRAAGRAASSGRRRRRRGPGAPSGRRVTAACSTASAKASARLAHDAAHHCHPVGGARDAVLTAPVGDPRRHVAGRRGSAGPGRRRARRCRRTPSARASNAARSVSPQVRSVSESSQVPITLVRNRIRPSTPPSLVKFAARASSVSTGWSSSTPTSPQVPHEMYAASGSVSGTPTTAEAVSCEPTATTGRAARGSPMTVPGSTRSAVCAGSSPTRASSSGSQLAACARRAARWSRRWCARRRLIPVSAEVTRSGISSSWSASASRFSAASW